MASWAVPFHLLPALNEHGRLVWKLASIGFNNADVPGAREVVQGRTGCSVKLKGRRGHTDLIIAEPAEGTLECGRAQAARAWDMILASGEACRMLSWLGPLA